MLVYQYSNSAIDKKGDIYMSEELRNAVETESWEDVDYAEVDFDTELRMTYMDYISAAEYN